MGNSEKYNMGILGHTVCGFWENIILDFWEIQYGKLWGTVWKFRDVLGNTILGFWGIQYGKFWGVQYGDLGEYNIGSFGEYSMGILGNTIWEALGNTIKDQIRQRFLIWQKPKETDSTVSSCFFVVVFFQVNKSYKWLNKLTIILELTLIISYHFIPLLNLK